MVNMITSHAFILAILCLRISAVISQPLDDESSWEFIVMSDWHGAEGFAVHPGPSSKAYQDKLYALTEIRKKCGAEVVIMPGDTNDGKWYDATYISKYFPGLSPQQAVYQAGTNCYSTIKNLFSEAGFEKVLIGIGDHEIGDNYWKPKDKDPKTLSLPQYRWSFTRALYMDPISGEYIFKDKAVGKASVTPYGTVYEYSSFAHVHKNVLFITVDPFYQISEDEEFMDRTKGLGGEGVITGDIRGEHLQWFSSVLKQAKKDETIKHIIVQCHLPVLQPVKKVNSSAMFIDRAENSRFWKRMVKFGVDVLLVGEVHATTVLKMEDSNLIQVASRSNSLEGFLKLTVTDDSLHFEAMHDVHLERDHRNKDFQVEGQLDVKKGDGRSGISSSGTLEVLDVTKPLIYFDFEKIHKIRERKVNGIRTKSMLRPYELEMQGKSVSDSIHNEGTYGKQHDAQVRGLTLVGTGVNRGISGKAAQFQGSDSQMGIYAMGPHTAGRVVSYSAWFKTKNREEMILLHFGPSWHDEKNDKNIFTLTLDNGVLKLYASEDSVSQPANKYGQSSSLNDGGWHQVAVTMPRNSCSLSEVIFIIDGENTPTVTENDVSLFFFNHGRIAVGGFGYSSSATEPEYSSWKPFQGYMDEVYVWGKMIGKDALRQSPVKQFEVFEKRKCGGHGKGTKKGLQKQTMTVQTRSECESKCIAKLPCLGYQTLDLEDGTNMKRCTLFKNLRPRIKKKRVEFEGATCVRLK